ncbi:MAG TPA: hypothetical protein VMN38_08550 [Sphingomicrobium sp.]|nr:hypothetical protein [Sphingomicrobium sp.]
MLRDRRRLAGEEQGCGDPDDVPQVRRFKLPNARLLSPLWHGDECVGLSGLYSVVNGIRLALAHKHQFSGPELHALITAGLRFMDGRLTPQRAVACGLRVQLWRRLVEALASRTSHRSRLFVCVDRVFVRPQGRAAAWAAVEEQIDAWRPVLTLMQGGRYSVVSGYTDASFLLFDSSGACWISKRVTGVPGDCEGARHVIYPTSFLALRA